MELQEKKVKGLEMYLQGKSLTYISEHLGINRITLTKYVKGAGVVVPRTTRKHFYNERYFQTIDSREKAYWLGFISADGSVQKVINKKTGNVKSYNLELTLSEVDKGHLHKFLSALDYKGNPEDIIKSKTVSLNGKTYHACRMGIFSTSMCMDLSHKGVHERKSLDLKFSEEVPEEFISDYIRGYFDGDGTIHVTKQGKLRLLLMGTDDFLKRVQNVFESLGATRTKICKGSGGKISVIEKGGKQALSILRYLYSDATVYLDRKYEKSHAVLRGNS